MFKKLTIYYFVIYNLARFNLQKRAEVGKNLRCRGPVDLEVAQSANLSIGSNFSLTSGLMLNPLGRNINSSIRIDKNATISIGHDVGMSCVVLWAKNRIEIGNNVKVGADVIIMDSDMHSLDYRLRRDYLTDAKNAISKPITIKDDAFIGTRSIITKGVTIGMRSIIASGSVVTKSIPDDEIWGGNPAKFIKKHDALQ